MSVYLIITLVIIALILGLLVGFLYAKSTLSNQVHLEKQKYADLDKDFASFQARTNNELENLQKQLTSKQDEVAHLVEQMGAKDKLHTAQNVQMAEKEAAIKALNEKLATLKEEVEKIGEKYAAEFKNLANEILEDKSQRFTQKNRENLEAILKPLDENIKEFKQTVSEVYDKESKERFSLGNEVKKLAELNTQMSEEARNLTMALKGDVKKQGDWGEMILENILEKSGLRKDEEYFLQTELKDEAGNPLRSDSDERKMRPDAIIRYPDSRSVIVDAKVSLNAYARYVEATDPDTQQHELNAHLAAIKNHIMSLSKKGYDDYDKSLDFVMMFVPSEPAYIAAMQGDRDLWSFAYDRRILLLSPINLITSLKLISDLWKREYQTRNAQAIADRGAALYDKFVGFVENLKDVGTKIESANNSYKEALGQLSTGRGNLVRQVDMLKELGVKPKKEIDQNLLDEAYLD